MRKLPSILFQSFAKKKRQKFRTIGDVTQGYFHFIKSMEHINYLPIQSTQEIDLMKR